MVSEAGGSGAVAGTSEILERLAACGIVPVVRLPRPDLAVPLARTLLGAGLPAVEITFRADGAGEAIAAIRRDVPELLVGAGTVLTVTQAEDALAAGAAFVVAPGTNPTVVDHVTSRGVLMLPGVATPSEIEANLTRGLGALKLFPAEVLGGVAFLKAVLGPYPAVRFVPTGGVSPANLPAYLALPNVLACGGTWVAPSDLLAAGDLASIGGRAREAAAIVAAARGSGASARGSGATGPTGATGSAR